MPAHTRQEHDSETDLRRENEDLRQRLEEAQETLRAIQNGEVDGLIVSTPEGDRVFTLQGEEHEYRVLVEQMGQGAAIVTHDNTILYCNRHFSELFQISLQHLMGASLDQVLAHQGVGPWQALLAKAIKKGRSRGECDLCRSDGSMFPALLTAGLLPGRPKPTLGVTVTDLTNEKHTEQLLRAEKALLEVNNLLRDQAGELAKANQELQIHSEELTVTNDELLLRSEELRESEDRFRTMADVIPQLAWMAHPDGHIFWYNQRWYAYTGTTPEQMQEWGWECLHDQQLLPEVTERWETSIATAQSFEMEFPLRGADGLFRRFLTRIVPLKDSRGQVVRWFGTNTDISDIREAEETLRESERRLALALESGRMGLWEWDLRTDSVLWNPMAYELLGLPQGSGREPLQTFWDRVHPDELQELQRIVGELIDHGGTLDREIRIIRPNGEMRWMAIVVQVLHDQDGRPVQIVGVNFDITDRKQMEQDRLKMLEAERAARSGAEAALRIKDDFLATVSHELRNPLSALLGWTRLLAKGKVEVPKAVEIIDRSATTLSQIVSDLLDMSRIVSGKARLNPEPTDLVVLVGAVLEGVRLAAEAKRIDIEASLDSHLQPIVCDPSRMQQIIYNLMSNAVKFTPEGGKVTVSVKRSDRSVEIMVSDTGQGIVPDFLPYLFDQFRQADQSICRHHGGLGLGLAIVKHLVELHGGTIQAQSEGEGRGATFTVLLPCHMVHVDSDPVANQSLATEKLALDRLESDLAMVRGRRILVVDDDVSGCELVTRVLEESGATARVATSGEEGLKLLNEFQPELVITDIGMPGMDGYQLIRKIRAHGGECESLPCLALTAYARPEDRDEAMRAGFNEYLSKPFDSIQLAQALTKLWQPSSEQVDENR